MLPELSMELTKAKCKKVIEDWLTLSLWLHTHKQCRQSTWKVANSVYLTRLPIQYQFILDPQWKDLRESG